MVCRLFDENWWHQLIHLPMGLLVSMQEFPESISKDTFAQKRLLIVETDGILKSFLKEQFCKEGFAEVFEVSKNEKVSELVLSKMPDLLLLGCDQPEKNEEFFLRPIFALGFVKTVYTYLL